MQNVLSVQGPLEMIPEKPVKEASTKNPEPAKRSEETPPENKTEPVQAQIEVTSEEQTVVPLIPKEDPLAIPREPIRAPANPSSEELIMNAVKVPQSETKEYPEVIREPKELREEAPKSIARSRKRRGISLDELDDEEANVTTNEDSHDIGPIEGKSIDENSLKSAWKSYADIMYEQKKYSFHSTLVNRQPEIINDHTIKLILENHVQKEHLDQEKAALMAYLREKLGHEGLALESEISEEDISEISFKTSRDQLREMVKKNPTLQKLYEQFDLDVD